eukprot:TRINITY_DN4848_c0_g1_i1.p1 TRINITY_DN4848_c0_g1~~TRINITY_DN4848_c0_g1_i1.p1  ORF type:complete len:128 (-),score=39.82 TRINITY_DN4848_c0_g1_i1:129-473(-)
MGEKSETKSATDAEKDMLRQRMQAKKTHYFDELSKEQKSGGAVEESEIQATVEKSGTTEEEMVAMTAAFAQSVRNKDLKKRISMRVVDKVWKEKRGDKKGPAEAMIQKPLQVGF